MSNLDRNVTYTYRMAINFTDADEALSQIDTTREGLDALQESIRNIDTTQIEETGAEVDALQESMDTLGTSAEIAAEKLKTTKQEIATTAMTLTAMSSAINGVTNGLIQLGLVSDEDAESIRSVNAGFQIMIGFAAGLKSLALVQEVLNLQALKGAIINTYNSVLESPWKLALVSAGAGAAMGVAAAYGTGGGTTVQNTTNNIVIRDISGGQAQAANSINIISGGKVL